MELKKMVFSLKPGNLEMAGNQTLEPGTDSNAQNLELIANWRN